jgi:hypothetical protein
MYVCVIFLFHEAGKTIADVDMVLLCSGASPNTSFISPDKLNEKVFFSYFFLKTQATHALLCTSISHNTSFFRPDREIREAQNCRDKKTLIFFFAFPGVSGKFGKQSLRFRAAKTFFFGITGFFVPE